MSRIFKGVFYLIAGAAICTWTIGAASARSGGNRGGGNGGRGGGSKGGAARSFSSGGHGGGFSASRGASRGAVRSFSAPSRNFSSGGRGGGISASRGVGGGAVRSFSAPSGGGRAFSRSPQSFSRGNWSGRQNWTGGANWNRGSWTGNGNLNRGNWNGGNWNRGNWNGGNWNRGTWAANNWNHGWNNHGWNGSWNHGWGGRDWDDHNGWWWWGIAPLLGSYWNNWYSGYWDNAYYGYPYYGYSAYYGYPVYDDYDYGYDYAPAVSVAPEPSDTAYADQPIANTQDEYLEQAVTAFQSGDYREAQRLAGHAVVDNPRDAAALELISLSAMGLGNYQAAAAEAHAVASLNGVPSWSQIYSFYGDLDRFTPQLRALETFVGSHPEDAPSQFLLGSLYLSMGYRAAAQQRLSHVVALAPNDRVAQQLLIEAGGQAPATAAQTIAPESSNAPIAGPPGGNPPGAVGVGNGAPPSSPPLPVPDDRSVSNPPSTAPATAAVPTGLRYY